MLSMKSSSWSVTTKLLKDSWLQIQTIALKATFMDNKLKSTLFQFVGEQTFGSSLRNFIVKNIANVLPNLWFKILTFHEESSITSLRLSNSNNGSTLKCNSRHIESICGFPSMDLEIHYSKTSLNSSKGGSLDEFIRIFPLKKSSLNILSNNTNTPCCTYVVIFFFSTSPQCKDVDFALLVENVYGIPYFISNHLPFHDIVTKLRHCQKCGLPPIVGRSHNKILCTFKPCASLTMWDSFRPTRQLNVDFPLNVFKECCW